jgi:glycosyltransferase involved in cell wall biosynthesis
MSKVLVATHEFVRRAMAGPGIRAYELSRQLHHAGHDVRLALPISTDLGPQPFEVVTYDPRLPNDLRQAGIGQDIVVVSCGILPHSPILRQLVRSLVVDLNDPFHLENLASAATDPQDDKHAAWFRVLASLNEQLRIGDFFLAASERQRDHWIGALCALNRVNPETFEQDPSLRSMIDVVGFGLPEEPPHRVAPAYREVISGIGRDDFVLLWNGGIWNWFDPVTLIEAIGLVAQRRPQLRLVFMSTTHPNPSVPPQVVATHARERAEALGLLGRHVFFNEAWVPYERRGAWLLEANVGVSTHLEHLETRYSYRTRLLDCFWAGLPVICTRGDSLADQIEHAGAGITVPPGDVSALAEAIETLIVDRGRRQELADGSRAIARTLTWSRVAEPLVRFCNEPHRAADLAKGPTGVAVPVPLVADEERARRMTPTLPASIASIRGGRSSMARVDFILCVSDRGNNFMRELAEYLAATLRPTEGSVTILPGSLPPLRAGLLPVIVAPHEYCTLDPDFLACDQEALLRRSAVVNTEQPGTPWFDVAVAYCARAGLVFDINEDGVAALRARGIEAHHFPMGYHVGIDRWGGVERTERDIDVVFMGDLNERRRDLLAQYAPILARHRFRLFPTDSSQPIRAESPHFLLGAAKSDILCRTKLLLDVQRGPGAYFAWQRILPALSNGAVVVTEQASGYAPLRPFEHLVMATYDLLPYYVEALLVDDRSRHDMARKAYAYVTSTMAAAAALPKVYPLLEMLAVRNAAAPVPAAFPSNRTESAPGAHVRSPSRGSVSVPSRVLPPRDVPAAEPVYGHGALLKRLFLGNQRLGRRIGALEDGQRTGGDPRESLTYRTPAWADRPGDVSVIVPVHNYEDFVDECFDSVLASQGVVPELVVVDDASTDGSADRVHRYMARHPELPLALIRLPVNRGLPGARNEGFRHARSEYVFVLDIDNLVYPGALARLRAALDAGDAGFAYGIIEWFGEISTLVSTHPWDVDRLVRGNYIDAMAMIRKSTWMRVGGYVESYPETEILYGWEDYDFWLGCAARGICGEFVAEILARYRSRKNSMLSITNLERETTVALLRKRHASLDWGTA